MTSFLDTIPLSQTATAKANAVWACHHSILSIPPTVTSHRPALYSSAGTAHTDAGCNRNQTGELENRIIFQQKHPQKHVTNCVSSFLMCLHIALKTHMS